jgi:pyruvate dehydrogenase (quinone)
MGAKVAGKVFSYETLKPSSELAATDADILEIVRYVDQVNNIVIMCGAGCRGLSEELRELSKKLKAPLIHSVKGKDIMSYEDPRWMGGLGMIGTKAVYNAVKECELLLMIGTDYPYSEFLPSTGMVIQIDDRPEVLGRRTPTVLGVSGSIKPTLKLLLNKISSKNKSIFFDKLLANVSTGI